MPLDNDLRHRVRKEADVTPEDFAKPAEENTSPWDLPLPAPVREPVTASVPNPVPTWSSPVPAPATERPVIRPAAIPTPAPIPPRPSAARAPEAAPSQSCSTVLSRLDTIERLMLNLSTQVGVVDSMVNTLSGKTEDPGALFGKLDLVHGEVKKLRDEVSRLGAMEIPTPPDRTDELLAQLQAMADKQEKTERMLTQALRENASFQQQVRQGMQRDLDDLRQQLSGTSFNAILKEIATMYSDYQLLLEDEEMPRRSHNNLRSLFEQMEDLLADYDAEIFVSKVGDLRPKNQCKIIEKIPTGDETLHNTIARSRKPGVVRDRLVLFHEWVDVYVYDPALKIAEEPVREPEADPAVPEIPAEPDIPADAAPAEAPAADPQEL